MPTPHELKFYVENRFLTGQEDGFAIYEFEGRLLHDKALTAKRIPSPTHDHCNHDAGAYQPAGCVARVSVYATSFVEGMKAMSKAGLDSLRNRVSRSLAFVDKHGK